MDLLSVELPSRTIEYQHRRQARLTDLEAETAALFPTHRQATLEIGCGHGHLLTAYAKAHPDRLCIGVDIMLDRVTRAERKKSRAELPNLHFIRADARELLTSMPPGSSIHTFLILFPDPWPKRRHHKNRIIQPDFLTLCAAKAGQGAQLCFRTDHEGYYADAMAVFSEHPDWTIVDGSPWPFEFETVFQSRAPSYQSVVAELRR